LLREEATSRDAYITILKTSDQRRHARNHPASPPRPGAEIHQEFQGPDHKQAKAAAARPGEEPESDREESHANTIDVKQPLNDPVISQPSHLPRTKPLAPAPSSAHFTGGLSARDSIGDVDLFAGGQPVSKQASTEPGRASSAVRELKIHGPFLLTREELAKAGQRARKFRPDPDDSDDFDDSNPAGPCIGPFCPEARAGESTLQIRTPPPTSTPWEVDPAIGALDPQIAASRTSLVVTAGVKIAFYGKDGK